jgi:hypothetical protein
MRFSCVKESEQSRLQNPAGILSDLKEDYFAPEKAEMDHSCRPSDFLSVLELEHDRIFGGIVPVQNNSQPPPSSFFKTVAKTKAGFLISWILSVI